MKLNKGKNKGKVHPSPSSSSSSSSSSPFSLSSANSPNDTVSRLNSLLPAAILTLISILSLQDKEVLAYMITHSLSSTSSFFTSLDHTSHTTKNGNTKKVTAAASGNKKTTAAVAHKIPSFDCGCFDCYTSYWFRWDSSPHRELIHQAIEAFEEHLATSELLLPKKSVATPNNKSRKNHKVKKFDSTSSPATSADDVASAVVVVERVEEDSPEILVVGSPEKGESSTVKGGGDDVEERESGVQEKKKKQVQQQQQHKGLARKVLPDVIGLFNSRLWNLWGPNV